MENYLSALLFAVAPAVGNFSGGLLAEFARVSERTLSLALHAAAGVVIAVVAVELMPQVLESRPQWLPVIAFVAGGLFYVAADAVVGRMSGEGRARSPWILWFAVAIDLLSDGIMIGAGSTIGLGLGFLLALGQTPADLPEGFATVATFKRTGLPRRTRLLLAAAFALPLFIGVTLGYWGVRGRSEGFKLALLAFTAGVLTTVVIEEIVPESHQGKDSRLATFFFVGEFALFTLVSAYFEV